MCKFIKKSNTRILCKLSKRKILMLNSIVHVAMETTKTSHFARQSKSFSIFFPCQVSACELQPFSRLANNIYLQTAKTVLTLIYWLMKLRIPPQRMVLWWRLWKIAFCSNFSFLHRYVFVEKQNTRSSTVDRALWTKRSCGIIFMKMKVIWFCPQKTISRSYLKQNDSDLVFPTRTNFLKWVRS